MADEDSLPFLDDGTHLWNLWRERHGPPSRERIGRRFHGRAHARSDVRACEL